MKFFRSHDSFLGVDDEAGAGFESGVVKEAIALDGLEDILASVILQPRLTHTHKLSVKSPVIFGAPKTVFYSLEAARPPPMAWRPRTTRKKA